MRAKGRGSSPSEQLEPRIGEDRGENGLALDHGEGAADASSRASAERHIGAAMAPRLRFGREARRIELKRVLPELAVAMNHIDRDDDHRAFLQRHVRRQ